MIDTLRIFTSSILDIYDVKIFVYFLHSYPTKIRDDFHYAHCYLPAQLIYMLHKSSELVAVAVDAFYNRDQIDIKVSMSLNKGDQHY